MYQNNYDPRQIDPRIDPRQYDPRYFYDPRGMNYTPRQAPKFTQPLTNEQIAKLRQGESAIDWRISEMDLLRASCTHKEKNGTSALIKKSNGLWHCTICGADFSMTYASEKQIQEAVDIIINFLQASKAMYLDAPESLIRNFYQIIPILEKFPTIYKLAWDNFNMHEDYNNNNTQTVFGSDNNGFQALNNMIAYNNPIPQPSPFMYQQEPIPQPNPYDPRFMDPRYGYPQTPPPPQYAPIPNNPTQYYDENYMRQMYVGNNPFMYGKGAPVGVPMTAPAPGVVPHPVTQQNNNNQQQQNPDQGNNNEVVQQKSFQI